MGCGSSEKNKTGFLATQAIFVGLKFTLAVQEKELRRFYCNSTCIQKTQTKLARVDVVVTG